MLRKLGEKHGAACGRNQLFFRLRKTRNDAKKLTRTSE